MYKTLPEEDEDQRKSRMAKDNRDLVQAVIPTVIESIEIVQESFEPVEIIAETFEEKLPVRKYNKKPKDILKKKKKGRK